jgi:Eukaryotic aspartyl protease
MISLTANGSVNSSNVKFLLVNRSVSINTLQYDGVLGLSPTFLNQELYPGTELFMNRFINASSIITSPIFSLNLARSANQSYLHIGGWNKT